MAKLDKTFKISSFRVPYFDKKDKLKWYKNYRTWKKTLELTLKPDMLLPFIEWKDRKEKVDASKNYRNLLNVHTFQVLQASVIRTINLQIQHNNTL